MVQILTPNTDISNAGGWVDEPLWSELIDSLINIVNPTTSDTFEVGLSTGVDPLVNDNHTLKYEIRNGFGSGESTIKIQLFQEATLIAEYTDNVPNGSVDSIEHTLTEEEAENITDYSKLQIKGIPDTITPNILMGIGPLSFEIPDAPTGGPGIPAKKKLKRIIKLQNQIIHRLLRHLKNCNPDSELVEIYQEIMNSGLTSCPDSKQKQSNALMSNPVLLQNLINRLSQKGLISPDKGKD